MLVNAEELLQKAKKYKYAVAQFNINNLEWTKYILEVAKELNQPVILGVSEGAAKYMGGYNVVSNMVKGLLKDLDIKTDVVLHLDHGSSFEVCKKAIDAGFTSVMIDGSKLPFDTNVKITREVVNYAKKFNVTVEGEIGTIGGQEDNIDNKPLYAKTDECIEFVNLTNVDMLAPALGSVHGLYKGEANLDFNTMNEISKSVNVPLVLHGATGIDDEKIRTAISCGISKINVNTEFQIAWYEGVKEFIKLNPNIYDPRKVIGSGENKIKKAIMNKFLLFKNDIL